MIGRNLTAALFVALLASAARADSLLITDSGVYLVTANASGDIKRTKIAEPVSNVWDDRSGAKVAKPEKPKKPEVKPDVVDVADVPPEIKRNERQIVMVSPPEY